MLGILSGFGIFLGETVGAYITEKGLDLGGGKVWESLKNKYTDRTCFESKMLHVIEEAVDKSIKSVRTEVRDEVCLAVLSVILKNNGITIGTLSDGLKEYERKSEYSIPDELKSNPNLLYDSLYESIIEDELLNREVELRMNSGTASSASSILKKVTDLQYGQQEIKERLTETLKEKNDQHSAYDFSEYYDYIKRKFKRKKRRGTESFVGNESDEKAYIDAFLPYQNSPMQVLRYLEQWFDEEDFGTILIHGEPGHGKTTLCNKAVFDHTEGKFLSEDKNVIAVSLNTGANTTIIENGYLHLENALVWGGDRHTFTFKDCRGALLFMDGFDEFIDEARKVGITDIVSFLKIVDEIAEEYDIRIVVMSRTTAVKEYLKKQAKADRSFLLLPVTEEQQDYWLECHDEYDDYRETFNVLRKNGNMHKLLGIPLLFRLIVHSRFDKVSSNFVELYDNLFEHLMEKRGICDDRLVSVRKGLMDLAYNIYCTDTDWAVMRKKELDKDWVFAFYITISGIEQGAVQHDYKVGFYHRSFYQFFLAKFIYLNLLSVTSENAEEFIGYFAERELDSEVRDYLSLMLNETDKERIDSRMDMVIGALVKTEAYCNLTPRYVYGNAEKSRIGRSTTVYRNVMHIAYALSYVIQIPFKDTLDICIKTFWSDGIRIISDDCKEADLSDTNLYRADLSGAYLSRADLSGADLSGAALSRADLSRADLSEAYLSRADLSEADMRGADLSGTDMRGADLLRALLGTADLSGANLSGADLSSADLSSAVLVFAYLSNADLSGANLSKAYLRGADVSGANLSDVDLSSADLSYTDMRGADMSGADLSSAYLGSADLSGANLSSADLSSADLSSADLSYADLRRANMSGADLSSADMRGAKLDMNINAVNRLSHTTIYAKYKTLISTDIDGYDSIKWYEEDSVERD